MEIQIKERGWAGHFVCADRCKYRRNTLITCGDIRVVVSSVGNMYIESAEIEPIGFDRYYETMAFKAKKSGDYWDADVTTEIPFESEWAIGGKELHSHRNKIDNIADEMHDNVVEEIVNQIKNGETFDEQTAFDES